LPDRIFQTEASPSGIPPAPPGADDSAQRLAEELRLLAHQSSANDPLEAGAHPVDVTARGILPLSLSPDEPLYSPSPIGTSREGYPIYEYWDGGPGGIRYVVQLPNRKAYFCDRAGRINPLSLSERMLTAAVLASAGGVAFGGVVGGLVAAAAGVAGVGWWPKVRSLLHGTRQ
jgi:hypothetical protein